MEAGRDIYSSKNYLFWIYEYEGECYLINNLPLWHFPLLFLGFYRASIFKLKAKKISAEEAQEYQNKRRAKNGPSRVPVTVGVCGSVGLPLVASNILRNLEKSTAFFSVEFYMVLLMCFYLIFFLVLYLYRKKYGFYKFKFDDAKIKVKLKDKKIKTWILYHLANLVCLWMILDPFTRIRSVIDNGGLDAQTFYVVCCDFFVMIVFSIFPMNVMYGDLEVIKKKK